MNVNDRNSGNAMSVEPNYGDGYWMSDKVNNLILKKIIDFLAGDGDHGVTIKPMLDSQKHVHLMVQRGSYQEEIVFEDGFPNQSPKIEVTGGVDVNNAAEWHFNGDIYYSFVRYYDDCFKKKATEGNS